MELILAFFWLEFGLNNNASYFTGLLHVVCVITWLLTELSWRNECNHHVEYIYTIASNRNTQVRVQVPRNCTFLCWFWVFCRVTFEHTFVFKGAPIWFWCLFFFVSSSFRIFHSPLASHRHTHTHAQSKTIYTSMFSYLFVVLSFFLSCVFWTLNSWQRKKNVNKRNRKEINK